MARRRKVRSVNYGTYKCIKVFPDTLVVDCRTYKSDIETYEYFKRIKEEGKDIKLFGTRSKHTPLTKIFIYQTNTNI